MWKDMKNLCVNGDESQQVPPGFRFHPTEEELLQYYLRKKIASQKIDLDVIPDVDLNKLEPWDIQEKCRMGLTPQKEWYLFSQRDKKYPTGSRRNRATSVGFWKATGRDKVIYGNSSRIIGMRKTLVFYKGRAPRGQKSEWIMHEYRLELDNHTSHDAAQHSGELGVVSEDGWVVCRVFKKKNMHQKALDSSPDQSLHSNDNNTGGVHDQILTYMPQNQTKNSNIAALNDDGQINDDALQATQFLHLPALQETQPTNSEELISSLSQDHCSFSTAVGAFPQQSFEDDMFAEIKNTTPLSRGWVALDRLAASHLDAQVHTSNHLTNAHSDYLNNFLHLPLHYDHDSGLINLCASIRPKDLHQQISRVNSWQQ